MNTNSSSTSNSSTHTSPSNFHINSPLSKYLESHLENRSDKNPFNLSTSQRNPKKRKKTTASESDYEKEKSSEVESEECDLDTDSPLSIIVPKEHHPRSNSGRIVPKFQDIQCIYRSKIVQFRR